MDVFLNFTVLPCFLTAFFDEQRNFTTVLLQCLLWLLNLHGRESHATGLKQGRKCQPKTKTNLQQIKNVILHFISHRVGHLKCEGSVCLPLV